MARRSLAAGPRRDDGAHGRPTESPRPCTGSRPGRVGRLPSAGRRPRSARRKARPAKRRSPRIFPLLANSSSAASLSLPAWRARTTRWPGYNRAGRGLWRRLSPDTFASTRRISAWVSGLACASRRFCTTSLACISSSRNRRGGISVRSPTFSASTPSFSARLTSLEKLDSGKACALDCRRPCGRPPGRRASPEPRSRLRRCRTGPKSRSDGPGFWTVAISTRSASLRAAATAPAPDRRPRCRRPARAGARPRSAHCRPGASRRDSSARVLVSISVIRWPNTSSNSRT